MKQNKENTEVKLWYHAENTSSIPSLCTDINECNVAESSKQQLCGVMGTCRNNAGSYWCMCMEGYSNYGNNRTKCSSRCTRHKSSTFLFW